MPARWQANFLFSLFLLTSFCLKWIKPLCFCVQATQTCAEALHHETKMRECSGQCGARHWQTFIIFIYSFFWLFICFVNLSFRSTSIFQCCTKNVHRRHKKKKIVVPWRIPIMQLYMLTLTDDLFWTNEMLKMDTNSVSEFNCFCLFFLLLIFSSCHNWPCSRGGKKNIKAIQISDIDAVLTHVWHPSLLVVVQIALEIVSASLFLV